MTNRQSHRANLIGLCSLSRRWLGMLQHCPWWRIQSSSHFLKIWSGRFHDWSHNYVACKKILTSICFDPRFIEANFYEANALPSALAGLGWYNIFSCILFIITFDAFPFRSKIYIHTVKLWRQIVVCPLYHCVVSMALILLLGIVLDA